MLSFGLTLCLKQAYHITEAPSRLMLSQLKGDEKECGVFIIMDGSIAAFHATRIGIPGGINGGSNTSLTGMRTKQNL